MPHADHVLGILTLGGDGFSWICSSCVQGMLQYISSSLHLWTSWPSACWCLWLYPLLYPAPLPVHTSLPSSLAGWWVFSGLMMVCSSFPIVWHGQELSMIAGYLFSSTVYAFYKCMWRFSWWASLTTTSSTLPSSLHQPCFLLSKLVQAFAWSWLLPFQEACSVIDAPWLDLILPSFFATHVPWKHPMQNLFVSISWGHSESVHLMSLERLHAAYKCVSCPQSLLTMWWGIFQCGKNCEARAVAQAFVP